MKVTPSSIIAALTAAVVGVFVELPTVLAVLAAVMSFAWLESEYFNLNIKPQRYSFAWYVHLASFVLGIVLMFGIIMNSVWSMPLAMTLAVAFAGTILGYIVRAIVPRS